MLDFDEIVEYIINYDAKKIGNSQLNHDSLMKSISTNERLKKLISAINY